MKFWGKRLACILLALAMLVLFGCNIGGQNKPQGGTSDTTAASSETSDPEAVLKLTELASYQVVYPKSASAKVKAVAAFLAGKLNISAVTDENAAGEKEILIGNTNRADSTAVAAVANLKTEATAFAIEVRASRIVIAGKNETSLIYGVKYFFGSFPEAKTDIPANYQYLYATANEVTVYDDHTVLEMGTPTLVYGATAADSATVNTSYPKVIRLEHSEYNAGALLATMEIKNAAGDCPSYQIFRSKDDGKTWETLAEIKDTKHALPAHWQPYLYELPMQIGSMPEGTLILAGCMSRYKKSTSDLVTSICLWRSFNSGLKWEHFSDVDQSYLSKGQEGVWEPFLECTEDGKLLCFYSEENDKDHYNQRLVYRESTDGVRWGEVKNAVALSDKNLRPGMLSVVKLNNGKYFATNELVGVSGGPIHYRIIDSLTEWGDVTVRGTKLMLSDRRMLGTSPWVGYIPGNGGCGLLLVSAEHMIVSSDAKGDNIEVDLFASLDYGATWFAIKNPMPYKNVAQQTAKQGYSSGFFTAEDGHTAYFIQATDWDYPEQENRSVTKIVTMKVW